MIRQFSKSWKENRGNLLLLLGSLAGLLMCLVWYFQLVPEVSLLNRAVPGTLVSASSRPSSSSLVAIIRNLPGSPLSTTASANTSWGEARQVIVEVYAPHDPLPHQSAPLLIQSVPLRDDGVPVAVVFSDLQPGMYAAVAYIDVNDSGSFDTYQAGGETVAEPFCLARLLGPSRGAAVGPGKSVAQPSSNASTAAAAADGVSLKESPLGHAAVPDQADEPQAPGVFEVTAGQATLIVLDFDALD